MDALLPGIRSYRFVSRLLFVSLLAGCCLKLVPLWSNASRLRASAPVDWPYLLTLDDPLVAPVVPPFEDLLLKWELSSADVKGLIMDAGASAPLLS